MVRGLKLFTERFAQYSGSYVLIGGSACDVLMDEAGLAFRATKDLDIVLCVEALSPAFVDAFWAFVEEGGYEIRQRGDGKRQFYRFSKPASREFPSMLELFSRSPEGLDIALDSHLTSIPAEDAVNSLSAILLDDDYYQCIQRGRREIDGVPILGVEYIIPFKVRAWLDLSQRKVAGEAVDSRDIRKHRGDIFRLYGLLPRGDRVKVSVPIQRDLKEFVEAMPREAGLNIEDFGIRQQSLAQVLATLVGVYALER
ncbi:hypothetical protein CWI75_08160 [Kineobactrum sediminis]|uniref:Nucleotidyl transferase AbiEii/AbiGii toxin family protein n=1 Tax=Kineobactrum sediminis TaxID=1905677 RepID=A0A2N5Y4Q2_9GAMM|nr:hypothetical protein [Kineobactrum sediminis]PLW83358.1 hypothetical protein CWI75_08160 [Kineobactrum sediminis]